jgi:hypothetical protein
MDWPGVDWPGVGWRNPEASGIEAAHNPPMTQNPPGPNAAYNGPHTSVRNAVAAPTATVV